MFCRHCGTPNDLASDSCEQCGARLSIFAPAPAGEAGAPDAADAAGPVVGATFLGKYRISKIVGHGGMGSVYQAKDTYIGRAVAIKTIRLDTKVSSPLQGQLAQRLAREARVAGRLTHPNVVTIFDAGEWQGLSYIVMEYVEGRSLASVLQKKKPLDRRWALAIAMKVAAALEAAHAEEIIHRDVKPGNVLIGDDGRIKLTDFGIAKAVLDAFNLTGSNVSLGTPPYMSPEQIRSEPLDGRADLFSLACVLYEMVSGVRPFRAASHHELIYKVLDSTVPKIPLPRGVQESYQAFFDTALAKRREDRFADAKRFAHELALLDQRERSAEISPETPAEGGGDDATPPLPDPSPEVLGSANTAAIPVLSAGEVERAARHEPVPGSFRKRLRLARGKGNLLAASLTAAVAAALLATAPWHPPASDVSATPSAEFQAGIPAESQSALSPPQSPLATAVDAAAVVLLNDGSRQPTLPGLPTPSPGAATATALTTPPRTVLQATAPALAPTPPPSAPTATAAPTKPPSTPTPRQEKPTRSTGSAAGTLAVNANPWGRIFIDGAFVAISPVRPVSLPPGRHVVVVENEYARARVEREVVLKPGDDLTLSIDLLHGKLHVRLNPPAEILLRGVSHGVIRDATLTLEVGTYEATVRREGYDTWVGTVEVLGAMEVELARTLRPLQR
ncbi:MAG: protein kinase [Candidatus Schekmanbacteria bacterium]|nr:protein kinase [Candidatus Schekmanbacteria bacterium]